MLNVAEFGAFSRGKWNELINYDLSKFNFVPPIPHANFIHSLLRVHLTLHMLHLLCLVAHNYYHFIVS